MEIREADSWKPLNTSHASIDADARPMRPGCPMAAPHLPLAVSVCGPWQSPHRTSIKERLRECRANFLDCWVRGEKSKGIHWFLPAVVMGLSCGFPLHPSQIAVENHERQHKLTLNLKEKHTETPWNDMEWTLIGLRPFSSTNGHRNFTTSTQLAATNHRLRIAPDLPSRAEQKRWLDMFLSLKALKLIMKMAIEIVDLPIEHGGSFQFAKCESLPESKAQVAIYSDWKWWIFP